MRDNRVRYKREPTYSDQLRIATLLDIIGATDGKEYTIRNQAVLNLVALCGSVGYPAGIRFDPEQPDWPVAVVELPTGQVSWHLPQHPNAWDGHNTEVKYERVKSFIAAVKDKRMAAAQRESRSDRLRDQ